jgi:hypothetical protein
MSTIILAILGAITLVLYVFKRRARLRAEEGNDNY